MKDTRRAGNNKPCVTPLRDSQDTDNSNLRGCHYSTRPACYCVLFPLVALCAHTDRAKVGEVADDEGDYVPALLPSEMPIFRPLVAKASGGRNHHLPTNRSQMRNVNLHNPCTPPPPQSLRKSTLLRIPEEKETTKKPNITVFSSFSIILSIHIHQPLYLYIPQAEVAAMFFAIPGEVSS